MMEKERTVSTSEPETCCDEQIYYEENYGSQQGYKSQRFTSTDSYFPTFAYRIKTNALSICPDKIFFVLDKTFFVLNKILFVPDKIIFVLDKTFLSQAKKFIFAWEKDRK